MAESPPPELYGMVAWLLGGGSIGGAIAWLGKRLLGPRSEPVAAPTPPAPDALSSHWLSRHIIKIDFEVAETKKAVDSLVSAVGVLTIEVNTFKSLLERERRERNRRPRK